MRLIADFHIHSHFSTATSRSLTPENLHYWSRLKGIDIIGTGDCVHPGWSAELREKLLEAGNGFFVLKPEYIIPQERTLPERLSSRVQFVLTAEISSIYKKNGKVRKVHNLCIFPDFQSLDKFQARLDRVGNIRSDGRPILGLDSRVILEMLLESGEGTYLIPAHIWTPWFSVLGSRSGFDSIEECYDDLTEHIVALETGLSSDPPMNRLCSRLDRFRLVSNSDAHSPEKLGREANIFDTDQSFSAIYNALRDGKGFHGTIEFFPEEGKYHLDGHRNCGIRWDPLETLRHEGRCPVCGREVTLGVMHRIIQLADRSDPDSFTLQPPHHSITQLANLLAEIAGVKSRTTATMREYMRLVMTLGNEFDLLLWASPSDIALAGGDMLAEGIRRLREGRVHITEGFDGEFGRIRVFNDAELTGGHGTLFQADHFEPADVHRTVTYDFNEFSRLSSAPFPVEEITNTPGSRRHLDPDQREASMHGAGPVHVIAGPGSGKTRILVERLKYLTGELSVAPDRILCVTFSNRATDEIRERIAGDDSLAGVNVSTFHALGLRILTENPGPCGLREGFRLIDSYDTGIILKEMGFPAREIPSLLKRIEIAKNDPDIIDPDNSALLQKYSAELTRRNLVDLGDLIYLTEKLLRENPDPAETIRNRYEYIMVDEFQDVSRNQYRLLRSLAPPPSASLMVIGDPDQSIYGFRGGSPHFIDEFVQDYDPCRRIKLHRTYRCPATFLKGASAVLMKNEYPAGRNEDTGITLIRHLTDRSEADWIAATIEKSLGGVRSFSRDSGITDGYAEEGSGDFGDYAILCRASFMFTLLAEALDNHGIPYQTSGEVPFLRREPLMSVIRDMENCLNGDAEPADNHIMGMIRENAPVVDILCSAVFPGDMNDSLMQRISLAAGGYGCRYDEFFRDVRLLSPGDDFDPRASAVSLITIHSAKGLEFDTVFIPGCENGIMPFTLFSGSDTGEEERLMYVAMTRAIRRLYLSNADSRTYRGRILRNDRSVFLDRIPADIIVLEERARRPGDPDDGQLKLF